MSFVPELNAVQAGVRLNRAYQHLLASHRWGFLRREALVNTVGLYTTGTVQVTNGSTAVTGVGTAWTTGMAGRWLRCSTQSEFYEIQQVTAANALTLTQPYAGASGTYPYTIFQMVYAKPTDCASIVGIRRSLNMMQRTTEWINTIDPERVSTGEPLYWANRTDETFEVWPVPEQVYVLRVFYMRQVPDLSAETDVPLVPERLVLSMALVTAYRQLASDPERGAHYLNLAQWAFAEMQELMRAAVEEDMQKLSLPTQTLADGLDVPLSNDFWMRHDVTDPRRW